MKVFSEAVNTGFLVDREREFLGRYYDLKLTGFVRSVANAGRAFSVAEPDFRGMYDYVLVLGLLHASDKDGVNVDVLPEWLGRGGQLDELSDSCLLHFGECFFAMMLSKKSAERAGRSFCEVDFYRSAARKLWESDRHIAAECLNRAMEFVEQGDVDMKIDLQFELVQLWMDSENYALAAAEAWKIVENFSEHEDWAKGVWLYYYGLGRSNNVDAILRRIDEVLDDKRCALYRGKLVYIKWWSLHRKRGAGAKVAAVEHELLTEYGDTAIAAPVLLWRATDHLARQEDEAAGQLLRELVEKFPATEAAEQAMKLLGELETAYGVR